MRAERALGTSRAAVIGRRVIHAFCLGHGTLIVNQLLGSFGPNVYALREKAGSSGLRQNGESRRTEAVSQKPSIVGGASDAATMPPQAS